MTGDREKWDRIHGSKDAPAGPPARVLLENDHLLPASGIALDLACGRGANALFLANAGLHTHAWDISGVALDRVAESAAAGNVTLETERRDVVSRPPAQDSFDVIVVCRFLDRRLTPRLADALRPRGLIFYQTFIAERVNQGGPRNPDYLLGENELLSLFKELRILVYREEGAVGSTGRGFRDEAMLVAQKH